MNPSSIRSHWAALGAAIAVSLGAGGIGISHATTSSGERPVYIPLDEPCRLADNRPAGIGPDASVAFDGWGAVGDCTLPTGTAGLALNVTAVGATQQTNLRFYPADTDVPGTANLNPTPGAPPIPNAVNVSLDAAGQFKVYNRFGTVAVVIDVMGVYDDHDHDDRYYTEDEVDEKFLSEIVLSHGTAEVTPNFGGGASLVQNYGTGSIVSGDGIVNLSVSGVASFGGVEFGLKELSYCIRQFSGGAFVTEVEVSNESDTFIPETSDVTDRSDPGCYTMTVNRSDGHAYDIQFILSGGGSLRIAGVQTTWIPVTALPASATASTLDDGTDRNGN